MRQFLLSGDETELYVYGGTNGGVHVFALKGTHLYTANDFGPELLQLRAAGPLTRTVERIRDM